MKYKTKTWQSIFHDDIALKNIVTDRCMMAEKDHRIVVDYL